MDADAIVVGAGPTGLMLACELCLSGVRPLIVERRPFARDIPRAGALVGQILRLLHYRGLLDRFEAASPGSGHSAAGYPFGNISVNFAGLSDPPDGMQLAQTQVERLLDERARELGCEIARERDVVALRQDDGGVVADVEGPRGRERLTGRFLVGCDGARSTVRRLAGIPFPGTPCPEVNRLAKGTLSDPAVRLQNGDLGLPGTPPIQPGFTPTDRGVFAFAWDRFEPGVIGIQTTEDIRSDVDVDDDAPMDVDELQDSIERVLGARVPIANVTRLSRYRLAARQAERYRNERVFLAGDAAHQFPATGIGLNVGMLDAVNLAWKLAAAVHGWGPAGLLDTYHEERSFAGARVMLQTQAQVALRRGRDPASEALRHVFRELLIDEQPVRRLGALIAGTDIRYPLADPNRHPLAGAFVPNLLLDTDRGTTSVAALTTSARPILLDLAGRRDLCDAARDWQHRIDIRSAQTVDRPADAVLIRPDAHVGWAAGIDEPATSAVPALRRALSGCFGTS